MNNKDFLVELGTEELPPTALKSLSEAFLDGIQSGLDEAGLEYKSCRAFASPRRLAVAVNELQTRQADSVVEKLGPNVKAAFDAEGNPSKAASGFARGCGVDVSELGRKQTDKGERLLFEQRVVGKETAELLPSITEAALAALPIPKRMRWGASRAEFIRPVHWLLMLLGEQCVECEILGAKSGNTSRGHRFHANKELTIERPADYQKILREQGQVEVCRESRREDIRSQVIAQGHDLGGEAVIDEDLLDEVTALVEWPVALTGTFEQEFLEVPAEALISSMSEHQKYFHVVDAQGQLLPNFITVSNIVSLDPQQVIAGNERVIRPRLADAAFFFNTDKKHSLLEFRERLKNVVFQQKLGTIYDKTERISQLAAKLAEALQGDASLSRRAGELSKADLVSDMVLEFDKMQGIAGRYYALNDGADPELAEAIAEQYLPKFSGDRLPETITGATVALADRLDTLVGIFGIGQKPTGAKDPFALRRASLGVLRILIEKQLPLDLRKCLQWAAEAYGNLPQQATVVEDVLAYVTERYRARYEEQDIPVEVFMAVNAKGLSVPLDIEQRVHAVDQFRQLEQASALAAANKRVSNILEKQGFTLDSANLDRASLVEAAEQQLADALDAKQQNSRALLEDGDYAAFLSELADLRDSIDAFFDSVMVMVDDEKIRQNRLSLLANLRALFLEVADISYLVPNK